MPKKLKLLTRATMLMQTRKNLIHQLIHAKEVNKAFIVFIVFVAYVFMCKCRIF